MPTVESVFGDCNTCEDARLETLDQKSSLEEDPQPTVESVFCANGKFDGQLKPRHRVLWYWSFVPTGNLNLMAC